MKTEKEIMEKIKEVTKSNIHVLKQPMSNIQVNAPLSLMQLDAVSKLDALWWCVGMPRPRYAYDGKKGI